MRALALTLLFSGIASAQGPAPTVEQPPESTIGPPPSTIAPPTPSQQPPPQPTPSQPPATPQPPPASPQQPSYRPSYPSDPNQSSIRPLDAVPQTGLPSVPSVASVRSPVSPYMRARWSHARNLWAAGGGLGLIGTGFTLSSVLVTVITGYPCNPDDLIHQINPNDTCNQKGMKYDPPKPTDAVPMLGYLGSSVSAFGFVLSASGLGQQHHLLRELGADIPRGPFYAGNMLGVLGFTLVGVGYFFGFTDYLSPHDQGVAILATTVTSAAVSALGSLLFAIDASRTKKAWLRLTTF